MPFTGDVDPAGSAELMMTQMFHFAKPAGVTMAVPFCVTEDLVADALVHSIQNPSDSDCLVAVIVDIVTVDATETIDVGLDSDGTSSADTLIDAGLIDAAVQLSSFSDVDSGTNGIPWRMIDKKGGTNDFVTFTCSAGTDSVAGKITLIFIPLNR